MKVALGSDHRGVELKAQIAGWVAALGHQTADCGASRSDEPCDYPDIAREVAGTVSAGRADRGILLCHSGIGMSIAANKVRGTRAALCRTREDAKLSRRHNDANVLVLSAGFTAESEIQLILRDWLSEPFEGGRHARRVQKITEIENRKE